jgi:hypothetical protein
MRSVISMLTGAAVLSLALMALTMGAAQTATIPFDACTLLTAEELVQITGRNDAALDVIDGETLPGIAACSNTFLSISVHDQGPLRFAARRKSLTDQGKRIEPLSGVGDEAFFAEDNRLPHFVGAAVATRVGKYELVIGWEVDPPATPASIRPQIVALAKAAATKLR